MLCKSNSSPLQKKKRKLEMKVQNANAKKLEGEIKTDIYLASRESGVGHLVRTATGEVASSLLMPILGLHVGLEIGPLGPLGLMLFRTLMLSRIRAVRFALGLVTGLTVALVGARGLVTGLLAELLVVLLHVLPESVESSMLVVVVLDEGVDVVLVEDEELLDGLKLCRNDITPSFLIVCGTE
jgi:hypothetical protein